jgi:holo-[acyl-carrier protein] synthase
MILGIGNDTVDIRRIEKTLETFGARFIRRVFTPVEIAKATRRKEAGPRMIASTYAKRFAVKEACSKALGTGFRQGVFMKDIGVTNLPSGKPTVVLTGGAASHLEKITPRGMKPQLDVTMTDEYPYAQAFVIISATTA